MEVRSVEEQFYQECRRHDLEPLWLVINSVVSRDPTPRAVPYAWRWEDVYPRLVRSVDVWPIQRGGERRVLVLANPGMREAGMYAATDTLYAGIQIVAPGEVAPAHRHMPSAIRFVIQGNGVGYTAVEGEKIPMEDYDFILTPNWRWHDHRNDGPTPVVWLDVLDTPVVTSHLRVSLFEPHAEDEHALARPDEYSQRLTADRVTQVRGRPELIQPPMVYKWKEVQPRLLALNVTDPYDGTILDYINPFTGGPIFPTFTCAVQAIPRGFQGRAHRHTSSSLYHVIAGEGHTMVDGTRIDWSKGDTFALPPWRWHHHVTASAQAILFVAEDRPLLQGLGLYREDVSGR